MSGKQFPAMKGIAIKFEAGGEKREVRGYRLPDHGMRWEFVRPDSALAIELPHEAMSVMQAIVEQMRDEHAAATDAAR